MTHLQVDKITCWSLLKPHIPNMATTMSSLRISMEPLDTKYNAVNMSPRCTRVSPGGTWVVLNFMERARKQPGLAPMVQEKNIFQNCR